MLAQVLPDGMLQKIKEDDPWLGCERERKPGCIYNVAKDGGVFAFSKSSTFGEKTNTPPS